MRKIQINLIFFPPLSLGMRSRSIFRMRAQHEFIEFEDDTPTISNLIEFLQRVYEIPIDQLIFRIVAKNGRAVGLIHKDGFKPYSDAAIPLSNGDRVSFSGRVVCGG